jgi:hypothetical protein
MTELRPTLSQVGIAVRWKDSPNSPPKDLGHIDIILPGGEPVGFYTQGDGVSGSASGLGGLVRAGGFVVDFARMASIRPEYVNLSSARARKCQSTIVLLNATRTAAAIVSAFWSAVADDKGAVYNLWGGNCASYALASLSAAGLLADESLVERFSDTPEKAFQQVSKLKEAGSPLSGYTAFIPVSGDQFRIVVES